jgi:hypothetical protein
MSIKLVISGPFRVLAFVYNEDTKQIAFVKNVLDNIQSKNIFVLSPPIGRFFELTDLEFENKQSWDVETPTKTYSNWYHLNEFILNSICDRYNIKHLNCLDYGDSWERAKDNQHFGLEYQKKIVEEFYKII